MYYFDYAATTPMSEEALDTYIKVAKQYYGHSETEKTAKMLKEQAADTILNLIDAKDFSISFTSGGSEANNLAVLGLANNFSSNKHFITSIYEHSSNYEAFKSLNHEVSYVIPDENGIIHSEDVIKLIQPNTVYISLMKVNNEIGVVNDVEKIFEEVKKVNASIVTHTDYVQGLGKVKIKNLKNIDMFSISAHKIYGPKSCGALVYRPKIKLSQVLKGGPTDEIRPGTQDLSLQVAFAKAVKMMMENFDEINLKIIQNVEYFIEKIKKNSKVVFNVEPSVNIVSLRIMIPMQSESIVTRLAKKDIIVSTKSACSSKQRSISRSLKVINLSLEEADHTLRISFSHKTTYKQIDYLVEQLEQLTGGK